MEGTLTVNGPGGAIIPAWGFATTTSAPLTPQFPGPVLTVTEGDKVSIKVVNHSTLTHQMDHNFVIQSISGTSSSDAPATDFLPIAPGASKTYSFVATKAGTYLYYDSLNNEINREMGLYGALIVEPSTNTPTVKTPWAGAPKYDFQRIWVTSDMDKQRWNDRAAAGLFVDVANYKANYFLINGMGGEDAKKITATSTAIDGKVGDVALVRILNAGLYPQTFHFHANHIEVISVNGVRRAAPYKRLDVIQVDPLGSADVVFRLNQPGDYPMHNHTAQMETANGFYLNGVVTMIYIKP